MQNEVQILNAKRHSFQFRPREVVKRRVHIVPDNLELDRAAFSARSCQHIAAPSLEIVSQPIKGDVVWVPVHAAGGGPDGEAAFDPIFKLANLIVCTLHCATLHHIFTHALAPARALSFQPHLTFLRANNKKKRSRGGQFSEI